MDVIVIILVIFLVLVLVGEIIAILYLRDALQKCEGDQSPYCYATLCPIVQGRTTADPACNGYTSRTGNDGGTYCSYAPTNRVN